MVLVKPTVINILKNGERTWSSQKKTYSALIVFGCCDLIDTMYEILRKGIGVG